MIILKGRCGRRIANKIFLNVLVTVGTLLADLTERLKGILESAGLSDIGDTTASRIVQKGGRGEKKYSKFLINGKKA